jgi:hypothetical protein
VLTAALAGSSPAVVEETADDAERWLGARFPDGVTVRRRLFSSEDLFG